jgi:Calx-beta domain
MTVLSVRDMFVGEGDRFLNVVVQMESASAQTVTVRYDTADAIARVGTDYRAASGTLAFLPGETSKVVTIDLIDDSTIEALEGFLFNLSAPRNATLAGDGRASIQIVDNDTVRDAPRVFVLDTVIDEQTGTARFLVTLGRANGESSLSTVSVDYRTQDFSATGARTAIAESDYRPVSGTLIFAPGESVKTVTVDIINDSLREADESFNLILSNASSGSIADGYASAFIMPSDLPAVARPQVAVRGNTAAEGDGFVDFFVGLNAPSAQPVTVSYFTQPRTANTADFLAATGVLTFEPGQTVKTVSVALLNDTTVEGPETFVLELFPATNADIVGSIGEANITDDDTAGTTVLSYGIGNDVYRVNSLPTTLVEDPDGGQDTVLTGLNNYTLPASIENLSLAQLSALNGTGNSDNNQFRGNTENNRLDGGIGIDTVFFSGVRADFTVRGTVNDPSMTVTSAVDGVDTLLGIERLRFTDLIEAWDTQPNGFTYAAYAIFNAGFDRAPSRTELSQWTSQLDLLGSAEALAQNMINHYAPGVSNAALVSHLWTTVIENPITPAELAAYVGELDVGNFTQAQLVVAAAGTTFNTVEFRDIVGQVQILDPVWFQAPGW